MIEVRITSVPAKIIRTLSITQSFEKVALKNTLSTDRPSYTAFRGAQSVSPGLLVSHNYGDLAMASLDF